MLHFSFPCNLPEELACGLFPFWLSPAWLTSYLDVPACLKCGKHEHEAEAEDDDVEERLSFRTHLDRMALAVVPRLTGHLSQNTRQTCPSHNASTKHCDPRLLKTNRGHMRCTWQEILTRDDEKSRLHIPISQHFNSLSLLFISLIAF